MIKPQGLLQERNVNITRRISNPKPMKETARENIKRRMNS